MKINYTKCEEPINYICLHCEKLLTGKQKKYCSKRCAKRESNKRWKKKYWKKVHAIIKTNKIKGKQRRKELTKQENLKRANGLHKLAMDLTDKAYIENRKKKIDREKQFILKAFQAEQKAAMLINRYKDLEPTRSVLFRSDASLAFDCGKTKDSEKLISLALEGNPPQEIEKELKDIIERINADKN